MNRVKLGDIASIQAGPFGTQLHKNEYVLSGIPILNSKNVGNGIVVTESMDYVPQTVLDRLPQYILREGDILFGRAGTIERHTYVTAKYDGCFQGTNCIRIRCNEKKYSLYISYYLWSNQLKQTIENKAGGSIQAYITTDLLKEITVFIPENYEEIAHILDMIDEKITNNYKINDNLQQQLKLLYDYWFTQFDFPDENGKPYRSSGGAMAWNEQLKRQIPVGWKVCSLSDLCEILLGGTPDTSNNKYWNGEYSWLNSGEIAQFPVTQSELKITKDGINNSPAKMMPINTTVVSITGNIRASILAIPSCANQSVVGILENSDYKMPFIYPYMCNLIKYYTAISTGNCQKHISKGVIEDSLIAVPSHNILEKYYNEVEFMYKEISSAALEINKLTTLRDWLLPMLMNGQIGFKEEQPEKTQIKSSGFEQWIATRGFAARGGVDMDVLRDIYGAMDDDDK